MNTVIILYAPGRYLSPKSTESSVFLFIHNLTFSPQYSEGRSSHILNNAVKLSEDAV